MARCLIEDRKRPARPHSRVWPPLLVERVAKLLDVLCAQCLAAAPTLTIPWRVSASPNVMIDPVFCCLEIKVKIGSTQDGVAVGVHEPEAAAIVPVQTLARLDEPQPVPFGLAAQACRSGFVAGVNQDVAHGVV